MAKSVKLTVCWAYPGTINITEQIWAMGGRAGGGAVKQRIKESGNNESLGV